MSVQIGIREWRRAHTTFLRRIWDQVQGDDLLDLAAQISFYFVLSLFPFFIVMAAIVGSLPSTTLWKAFATWMVTYLPTESRNFVFSLILNLSGGSKGILSLGLVTAIWSASSGFVSLMESLSVAHGRRDTRSFWCKHSVAVCFTFLAAVFALACFGVMTLGRWGSGMIPFFSNGWNPPNRFWQVGRWAATLVLMCGGVDLVNYFLPDRRRAWRWLSPGTLFAVLMLLISTVGLNLYVVHFSSFPKVYGALGGFIVLMLWIYIASFILLVGAVIDHQIEAPANSAAT
jgi:membrane protein